MNRAIGVGLAVFVLAAGASVLMLPSAGPPWQPLALLGVSAVLGVAAAALVGLSSALARLRGVRASGNGGDNAASSQERGRPLARLQVDVKGHRLLLPTSEIDWIEASGNYVRLHAGDDAHLYRASLGELAGALDPSRFLRVHRSAVVNLDAVRAVDPLSTGDAILTLASGAEVRMSRRYADAFHAATGRG